MYIRRKVYSDVDYDYGYDYDYEEPRYYSVIMDEDELALFSDLQEYLYSDEGDTGSAVGAALGGLGAAAALGGGYAYTQSDRFKKAADAADARAREAANKKKQELAKALKEQKEAIQNSAGSEFRNLTGEQQQIAAKKKYESEMQKLKNSRNNKGPKINAKRLAELEKMEKQGFQDWFTLNKQIIGNKYETIRGGRMNKATAAAQKAHDEAVKGLKDTSKRTRFAGWLKENPKLALAAAGGTALGAAALGSGIGRSVNRRRD